MLQVTTISTLRRYGGSKAPSGLTNASHPAGDKHVKHQLDSHLVPKIDLSLKSDQAVREVCVYDPETCSPSSQ